MINKLIMYKDTGENKHKKQKMVKNKKAQGHVEIMLSVVLFIGALIFIFIFLNPFSKADSKISVVDKIEKIIVQNITGEVGKLSIITGNAGDCYEFIDSNYNGDYIETNEGPRKYNIYFSDTFINYAPGKDCSPLNYTLGVYIKEDLIIEDYIINLKNNYESDYSGLKSDLGILYDFSFNLKYIGGDAEIPLLTPTPKNPPIGVDVESKEIPIRMIKSSNAEISELILNIKVW